MFIFRINCIFLYKYVNKLYEMWLIYIFDIKDKYFDGILLKLPNYILFFMVVDIFIQKLISFIIFYHEKLKDWIYIYKNDNTISLSILFFFFTKAISIEKIINLLI